MNQSKKILYFGGQKSGKTALSIEHTLELCLDKKPNYIATYLNIYDDMEMQKRVDNHVLQRADNFNTIEEGIDLPEAIEEKSTTLVDCLSMWILNNIDKDESWYQEEINKIMKIDATVIFILNDVSCGVIPIDKLSRKFVDLSGIVGTLIAKDCEEVYQVNYGIKRRIK